MARFRQSVVINRPVEQVFAFISDLENDPPWSGAAEMRRTSPGPVGVGTTFQQRDRLLGRRLELTLRVVGYEPDRKVTITTASRRLSFSGTRMVEPVGQGATRVTFVGAGRAGGVWRPAEPLLAAVGGRRLRRQLGRLKRLLESQPQS